MPLRYVVLLMIGVVIVILASTIARSQLQGLLEFSNQTVIS